MNKTYTLFLGALMFMAHHISAQKTELFMDGIVSTSLQERDFARSPTGDEIFFTRSTTDGKFRFIVQMNEINGSWSEGKIASFSGKYNDLEPFFSPDGQKLFFASNRSPDQESMKKDFDIWVSNKTSNGWSMAIRLDTIINSEGNEFYPAVAANGDLYFTGERADTKGTEDIYVSKMVNGEYSKPISLSENINSKTYEFNAYVSPDNRILIFSSYGRPDGQGKGDLYYSIKGEKETWQKAIPFNEGINSTYLDYCPYYDIKNGDLYFTSNRIDNDKTPITAFDLNQYSQGTLNGFDNIYKVHIGKLE